MLKEGVVSSDELRQMTIETIERLNPVLNAVVVPSMTVLGLECPC